MNSEVRTTILFSISSFSGMRTSILVISFFAFVVLVPVIDVAICLVEGTLPGRRYAPSNFVLTGADVRNSTVGTKLEGFFNRRSILYHGSGAFYNEWMFRMFGRAPGVIATRDDWLFLKSNSLELEGNEVDRKIESNLQFISKVGRNFEESGSQLLVAVIPNRSRLYPDLAYGSVIPPNRQRFFPEFVEALEERGVWCLDFTDSLAQLIELGVASHFETDHHWSYLGSQAAARATAEEVRLKIGQVEGASPRSFEIEWTEALNPPNRSLVSFLKFRKESDLERRFLHAQKLAKFDPDWRQMVPGEAKREILVLESSFGMFGFSQFLEMAFGNGVDAVVEPGNGSVFAPALYLSNTQANSTPYRLIVWVIPEYHLLEGLENQGAGAVIEIPNPLAEEEIGRIVFPTTVRGQGLSVAGQTVKIESESSYLDITFPEPIDAVRMSFRCQGGVKRGQFVFPLDGQSGPLIYSGVDQCVDYDFRLPEATKEFRVKMLFRSSEYQFNDWEVQGIISSSSSRSSDQLD